jgi:hypothetical protein
VEAVAIARMRTLSWWCCLQALAGCGPSAGDDGEGEGSATAGSTTTAASTGASASSTVADVDTSDAGTSADITGDATTLADDTTATAGSSDATETGDAVCDPPEEGVTASFSVSPDEAISAVCTVSSVTFEPQPTVILLDCDGQPITLELSTTPQSAVPSTAVGSLVQLDYAFDQIFWINRWLSLRSAGGESDQLLVGGVASSVLDPPGTTLEAFFGGSSLGVPAITEVDGICMPVDDRCGPLERTALDFTLELGATVRVLDQTTGFVDVLAFGWWFTVEEATRYPRTQACDDVPPAWLDFMMVWFPSD